MGTWQSGTEEFGVTQYTWTYNDEVGYLMTAVGWLLGAYYEAAHRHNGFAALLLAPLGVLAGVVAMAVFL